MYDVQVLFLFLRISGNPCVIFTGVLDWLEIVERSNDRLFNLVLSLPYYLLNESLVQLQVVGPGVSKYVHL